jgi:hypothetical protein
MRDGFGFLGFHIQWKRNRVWPRSSSPGQCWVGSERLCCCLPYLGSAAVSRWKGPDVGSELCRRVSAW